MNKGNYIFILFLFTSCVVRTSQTTSEHLMQLHGGDSKYWDLVLDSKDTFSEGYGWTFYKNEEFRSYYYLDGVRVQEDFHDVKFEKIPTWSYTNDTLYTMDGHFKFKVLQLTSKKLKIVDFNNYLGKEDTLVFKPSTK